jgi:PST family polysaccharide transporter
VQKAFRPATGDLGRRVISGAAFTILALALEPAVTLGSMAVLARLLTPSDFGRYFIAHRDYELAVFANFGFGSILIPEVAVLPHSR